MKETNAHTPGPWHVNKAGGISGDGEVIVINDPQTAIEADQNAINDGFGNAKANAKLIAAAPELLQELQTLVGIICSLPGYEERDVNIEDCDTAKAAIAKARGAL